MSRPLSRSFASLFLTLPLLGVGCAGISTEAASVFDPAADDGGGLDTGASPDGAIDDTAVSTDGATPDTSVPPPGDSGAPDTFVFPDTAVPPDTLPPPPDGPIGPPPNDTCGTATPLAAPTTARQVVVGDSTNANNDYTGYACNNGDGLDVVYRLQHPGGDLYVDSVGSSFDTVLSVETGCDNTSITRACSDSTSTGPGTSRAVYRGLGAGNYYLFVDGQGNDEGGPYRLGYSAVNGPQQLTCDNAVVISDSDLGGSSRALGMDIYDRFLTGQNNRSQIRSATAGGACKSMAGQSVVGRGMEQIYRLNLKAPRTVTVSIDPIQPTAFSGNFDMVAYVRDGAADPVNLCTQYQASTLAADRCVTPDAPFTLPAGTYFLIFDSVLTSTNQQPQGRFRAHVQVE
jgi:hypothetical protein